MSIPIYSEQVLARLHAAGWFPGRSVDTTPYEAFLRREGYFVTQPALEFWREFGGLTIPVHWPPRPDMPHLNKDDIRVYYDNLRHTYPDDIRGWMNYVPDTLSPVGYWHGDQYPLLVGESGKVYTTYYEWAGIVADSGAEAIENICTRRLFIEIEDD